MSDEDDSTDDEIELQRRQRAAEGRPDNKHIATVIASKKMVLIDNFKSAETKRKANDLKARINVPGKPTQLKDSNRTADIIIELDELLKEDRK
eukprot:2454402-Ditylum_brightwellii.AAC.1